MAASLSILYFAWVRDQIGRDGDVIDHPGSAASVADVVAQLRHLSEGHALALKDESRLRAACDQQFVALDTALGTAQEVALFPPVTGG